MDSQLVHLSILAGLIVGALVIALAIGRAKRARRQRTRDHAPGAEESAVAAAPASGSAPAATVAERKTTNG